VHRTCEVLRMEVLEEKIVYEVRINDDDYAKVASKLRDYVSQT